MNIKILLFATLKDLAGKNRLVLELPGEAASVADVRQSLIMLYPEMQANVQAAIAAVNEEYAFPADMVKDGDEVALFPPVSGGAESPEIYDLAEKPVDMNALVASITVPATGAVCVFSGMVRGETQKSDGQQLTEHLEYEAYAPMALGKMRQVASEIRKQWPLVQGIAIVQRIGKLSVGENTIVIACSSGHRDEGCFEGARYGIDRLKEIVPIWKKEVSPEGEFWIEGQYTPNPEDRSETH